MRFKKEYDLICVGGGIMSATLALIAKLLKPEITKELFDKELEKSKVSLGL